MRRSDLSLRLFVFSDLAPLALPRSDAAKFAKVQTRLLATRQGLGMGTDGFEEQENSEEVSEPTLTLLLPPHVRGAPVPPSKACSASASVRPLDAVMRPTTSAFRQRSLVLRGSLAGNSSSSSVPGAAARCLSAERRRSLLLPSTKQPPSFRVSLDRSPLAALDTYG